MHIVITITHAHTYTGQIRRGINRKQPKQTLDYSSYYSSRESHQSIWHEAGLSGSGECCLTCWVESGTIYTDVNPDWTTVCKHDSSRSFAARWRHIKTSVFTASSQKKTSSTPIQDYTLWGLLLEYTIHPSIHPTSGNGGENVQDGNPRHLSPSVTLQLLLTVPKANPGHKGCTVPAVGSESPPSCTCRETSKERNPGGVLISCHNHQEKSSSLHL